MIKRLYPYLSNLPPFLSWSIFVLYVNFVPPATVVNIFGFFVVIFLALVFSFKAVFPSLRSSLILALFFETVIYLIYIKLLTPLSLTILVLLLLLFHPLDTR